MMNTISNGQLTVGVKTKGAELSSIRNAAGAEFLWQGNPEYWAGQAPVLFPIVGRLRNDEYELNGKTYSLLQHGFARKSVFTLVEKTDTSLTFELRDSAETRAVYPFSFSLQIIYRLSANRLAIEYLVKNTGGETLPFSIGAHPAFNLPAAPGECRIEFEKPETLLTHVLNNGLFHGETVPVLNNETTLTITKNTFDRDALVFHNTASSSVKLYAKNKTAVTFEYPEFTQLGIWAKPGAPYVCIEPWFGYADSSEPYGSFTNKPGLINLAAGNTFSCEHCITIN